MLAGCGTATIDARSAATGISRNLAQRFGVAPPPVHCPPGVTSTRGRRFTCTTTIDGQALTVNAVVTGGSGQFEPVLDAAVLVVSNAEKTLAADVSKQLGQAATVSCPAPHRLLVVRPGQSFECVATAGGATRSLKVTVTSANGKVSYTLGA